MANTIPQSSVPIASTQSGTTGALAVTLGSTSNTGRSVYLTGFSYQSTGATTATSVTITVNYIPVTGSAVVLGNWNYNVVGTAGAAQAPLDINLIPPFQSAQTITGATNTQPVGAIFVQATAAGAGATAAALNAWGYLL